MFVNGCQYFTKRQFCVSSKGLCKNNFRILSHFQPEKSAEKRKLFLDAP
jgi:hypothetical protein